MNRYIPLIIFALMGLLVVVGPVYAIDNQFEVSLTIGDGTISTTTPTTTPPIISPVTSGGSTTGSSILEIRNLNTLSSHDSSLISFVTNHPTQAKVYWGLTENYELGSISGLFYGFDHTVNITGLRPETKYYFKVEVVNGLGAIVTAADHFQTLRDYSYSPLANVTHFQAIPKEDSIALLWNIPRDEDIDSVRIVRSDRFFPRDINDGEIIFEGNSEEYLDKTVVKGRMYYYALFAKDINGNYSSGVLAKAKILVDGQIIPIDQEDPFIGTGILENTDPIIRDLKFSDFDFIQDGQRIENTESIVTIDGKKDLTIILDYDKVPEILKTIAITLVDPEDTTKVFTFLLRIDKEKTGYVATIASLNRSGKFKISIIVLDYKNQGLKRIEGMINALVWEERSQELFRNCGIFDEFDDCRKSEVTNKMIVYIILLILLIITILGFIFRRRDNKKESSEIHEE